MPLAQPEPRLSCRLIHLAETGSTNSVAFERVLAGEVLPFWVLADRQSAGRGRGARAWVSGPGNLSASLAMPLACAASQVAGLSLVAGVAVMTAIGTAPAMVNAGEARLKWPNDLLVGGAKAGGILIESSTIGDKRLAVIGIGMNLAVSPDVAGACVLAGREGPISARIMLSRLDAALAHWLGIWRDGEGFERIRQAWISAAGPIGEPTSVKTGSETLAGAYKGLGKDGALIVELAGGSTRAITFGDVTVGSVEPNT